MIEKAAAAMMWSAEMGFCEEGDLGKLGEGMLAGNVVAVGGGRSGSDGKNGVWPLVAGWWGNGCSVGGWREEDDGKKG